MKSTSVENVIQMQFDSLVKRVVSDVVKDYNRKIVRREKHEVTFSDLNDFDVESIGIVDEHELDSICFEVMGITKVKIYNEQLASALLSLSEKKEILFSCFIFWKYQMQKLQRY